jgi:hypothetical protein
MKILVSVFQRLDSWIHKGTVASYNVSELVLGMLARKPRSVLEVHEDEHNDFIIKKIQLTTVP